MPPGRPSRTACRALRHNPHHCLAVTESPRGWVRPEQAPVKFPPPGCRLHYKHLKGVLQRFPAYWESQMYAALRGPPTSLSTGSRDAPIDHLKNLETTTRKGRVRRPRTRMCLLKGCQARYRPRRASQRYCSGECREAARVWSRWKAQLRYRATLAGKEKRKAQSCRYRERARGRNIEGCVAVDVAARVITMRAIFDGACDRPGCYEGFVRSRRSPLQRFCTSECRRALERVRDREQQWHQTGPGGKRPPTGESGCAHAAN